MAKKKTQASSTRPRSYGATRTTAVPAKRRSAAKTGGTTKASSRSTSSAAKPRGTSAAKKVKAAGSSVKKHVGDVLGISRARVSKSVPRASGDRPKRLKGIEVGTSPRRTGLKRAGVVGGVRGRGR